VMMFELGSLLQIPDKIMTQLPAWERHHSGTRVVLSRRRSTNGKRQYLVTHDLD
jgi:hypothetical protein